MPLSWIFLTWFCLGSVSPAVPDRSEESIFPDAGRQAPDEAKEAVTREKLRFKFGKSWRLELSPVGDFYPRYLADPIRPGFVLKQLDMIRSAIPMTGDSRYAFNLGGRYGFLRLHPEGDPSRGFQFDGEGAFVGQFDSDNNTDNIGWDGVFGFHFAWTNGKGLAFKLGGLHDSSHIGDEYAERTGRKRINYTREEWNVGASLAMAGFWRFYGEAGWAYDLRNPDLQKRWRAQSGIEYLRDHMIWKDRIGFYGALNLGSTEERDWETTATTQAGLILRLRPLGRVYRAGFEYHDGKAAMGEFFQADERYLALGFWLEL